MDIFKVPTCCSCHLVGYKEAFPPLASPSNSILTLSGKRRRPIDADSSSSNRNSQYGTASTSIDDDFDEGDGEDSNIAYQFGNGFKRIKPKKSIENNEPVKNRQGTKRTPIFPDSFLTPPANNFDSNFPFASRGPTQRQRTPPLKRKNFDQNYSESDLKVSRVTIFPPKPYSQSMNVRKVTPPISSTIDPNSVNLRLANAQNNEQRRINYNYHPIIDFFEDEEPKKAKSSERKTGKLVSEEDNWRPMVGG